MLKQAYTGVGLCVTRRGDDLLFSGSGWAIATEKGSMDKKQLAAVIELTGELPGDGEALKATKEENQYEIGEVHWDMIDRTENREEEEKLTVTQLKAAGSGSGGGEGGGNEGGDGGLDENPLG